MLKHRVVIFFNFNEGQDTLLCALQATLRLDFGPFDIYTNPGSNVFARNETTDSSIS